MSEFKQIGWGLFFRGKLSHRGPIRKTRKEVIFDWLYRLGLPSDDTRPWKRARDAKALPIFIRRSKDA